MKIFNMQTKTIVALINQLFNKIRIFKQNRYQLRIFLINSQVQDQNQTKNKNKNNIIKMRINR